MAKKNLLQAMHEFVDSIIDMVKPEAILEVIATEQAISMPDLYAAVSYVLYPPGTDPYEGPYKRLIDCYLDGTDIYAVIGVEGKLYKALVTVVNGGVTLGELTQVEIDYKPVTQSFKVMQQADGKYRWFAFPAATAVLNKNGYLNSRELYDNFVKHIQDGSSPMPYLSFYHVDDYGQEQRLELGVADFVEREGYTLLISGTFNDTALAKCLEKSTDVFNGTSIGYLVDPETIQKISVDNVVTIPVHTDGTLLEVSAMQGIDAACVMTAFYSKGVTMNQTVLNKLKKLAGDDPEALKEVEALAAHVDQTNQNIEADNLVRQENTTTPKPPAEPPAEPPATPPAEPPAEPPAQAPDAAHQEISLTEEAMQAIAEHVSSGFAEQIATLQTTFQTAIDQSVATINTSMTALQARLDALEKTDQAKVAQIVADLPRTVVSVVRQSSKTPAPVTPPTDETDLSALAENTLATLQAAQAPRK